MNIRKLIKEEILNIFEIFKNNKITCDNCGWSWEIENNDKNPYLCHKCGFDDVKKGFNFLDLKKWKKEYNIK